MGGFIASPVQAEYLAHVAEDLAHRFVVQPGHQHLLHPGLQVEVVDLVRLDVSPAWANVVFNAAGITPEAAGCDLVAFDIEPQVDVVAKGVALNPRRFGEMLGVAE